MPSGSRDLAGALVVVAILVAWSCGEATKPVPTVSSVVVNSPIGPHLGVGRSVQLVAAARDAGGTAVPGVVVTWTSSAPGIAAVSSSGLVTGVAQGTATITALAQGVSGSLSEQVLAADFAGARALFTDPFASALVGGTTSTLKAQLQGAVTQCVSGMDSGNFDTMAAALTAARTAMTGASDATDQALTATFALFVDQVQRLLRL